MLAARRRGQDALAKNGKATLVKNFRTIARTAVALLFFTSGLGHLFAPGFFLAIMPPELPLHHEAVFVSGVFELLGAVGLMIPSLRRAAGFGLFLLTILVTPANIYMWRHPELFPQFSSTMLFWRLPAQAFLLALIYWSAIRRADTVTSEPIQPAARKPASLPSQTLRIRHGTRE